jgi:hypothetical protein
MISTGEPRTEMLRRRAPFRFAADGQDEGEGQILDEQGLSFILGRVTMVPAVCRAGRGHTWHSRRKRSKKRPIHHHVPTGIGLVLLPVRLLSLL